MGDILNGKSITVSVCVISFNHVKYIFECLHSIINQRCDFQFEVIVRDDNSTDGTGEIVADFQSHFPLNFRVLPGDHNLGANRNLLEVFRHARGEYIALCEGDDYWLDSTKLQQQVDALRRLPHVAFCSSACRLHGASGLGSTAYLKGDESFVETSCDDVLAVAGQFAPTASYLFRKTIVDTLPRWFDDAPVGDFFLEMYGIAAGGGLHLNAPLAVYRTFSENSWSTQYTERNAGKFLTFATRMIECLQLMREETRFSGLDFRRKLAGAYFNRSIAALLLRQRQVFQQSIASCWDSRPWLSSTQLVLYLLKSQPGLARALYLTKQRIIAQR